MTEIEYKQIIDLMTEFFVLDDSPEFLYKEKEDSFVQKLNNIVSQSNDSTYAEVKKMIRKYKINKLNESKN
jgi:hypothetical protein